MANNMEIVLKVLTEYYKEELERLKQEKNKKEEVLPQ